MKTEDTEALGRQRAKPIKIKAQYSYQPVRTAHVFGTIITVHNTVTQTVLFIFIPLPPDEHHISDVAK